MNPNTCCTPDFTLSILKWFEENGRDLPWRHTKDPYAIWLSEIILQQTRIEQGWPYWERFMNHWPTVEQLAGATVDEVLREWQGLGYYSRARHLHQAAKQIVEWGGFPQTLDTIRQLKGVGPYTAAAIASIAFDWPVAVVDGNVFRVLARHFGIDTPINTNEGKNEFATLAQSLLPAPQASAFNQAMMDFGAIQCTPHSPNCLSCPLQESCMAFREGRVGQLPVKLRKLIVKERRLTYYYIRYHGTVAMHRRGEGDIWHGLWEPYMEETPQNIIPQEGLIILRQGVKHILTHRRLIADFYLWETDTKPSLPPDYIWIAESDLDQYALPRLIELLLQEVSLHA